ncbi:DUF2213 domain-containing protein [Alsobacter sp. KACC 23698]|uniref:DUF2213 domain-containing protein n=1 Tax=Alsobacter sp. KACC 23698 TaxID=3149229 RepID=A0AAU7JN64_9HYPH
MTTITFTDAVSLTDTRTTRDGYLVADARIARTGIQIYLGAEMGRTDLAQVRVYRPEGEVFHADSLASFAHRPVTNDHPAEMVTAANWKKHAIGMMGGEVARDGTFIRVPLTLMDSAAIEAVKAGKRELSAGYQCDIDWTAGQTPQGEAYDAVQKNIRANHLAIVDAGRAGPLCRIGDKASSNTGDRSMTDKPTKTVIVDGIPIETTDQGATVIDTLQKRLADANKASEAFSAKVGELTATVSAKDGEIAVLKKQVEDAALTPAKLDAAVAARTKTIADAKAIAGDALVVDGKTDAEITRAAVVAKLGDAAKDMDDAAIGGAFRALAASNTTDPVRDALRTGSPRQTADGTSAHAKMVDDLQGAWKTKGAA